MSDKKMVRRSFAVALGIICIVLVVVGLVGAVTYVIPMISDKDNTISSLNLRMSQLNTNNTNLQNQIASLNSTISSLNTQVASLQNQAQALQTQMNELLNETTIPLSCGYTVGDYMIYNTTTTVILLTQNQSATQTGTISMDVISFDGENYTINETASMQLAGSSTSFTFMEKINKTGYGTILSEPSVPFNSMLTSFGSPIKFFQKDEAKVGEAWQFPIGESGNLSFGSLPALTGNMTFTFGSIQNITVPAGTYRVFSLDVSGSMSSASLAFQAIFIGHEYLEYGTCRLIDSSFQENISSQTGGQTSTTIDFMQMELVQDTNH
jgi:uncharacterized coiled-coil protein SlyX